MASSAKLDIIVSLINEASSELASLKKDLGGVGDAAKESGRDVNEWSAEIKAAMNVTAKFTGGLAVAAVAAKKFFDITKSGADVAQTRESFEGLGFSLDALKEASGGTVDEMTLMSGAMTLLAGTSGEVRDELTSTMPQLLEIAKAANKLNPSLGSTAFLFESLATGVKRGSKLLIDNTGITFGLAEAYENYAAKIDISVDALTDEQKKLALLNQTLETGQILIEQAGGDAEAYADSWERMGAIWQDRIDQGKELYAMKIIDADQWDQGIQKSETLSDKLTIIANQYRQLFGGTTKLTESEEAHAESVLRVSAAAQGYSARLAHYKAAEQRATDAMWETYEAQGALARQLGLTGAGWSDTAVSVDQYNAAIASYQNDELLQSFIDMRRVTTDTSGRFDKLSIAANSNLTPSLEDLSATLDEQRQKYAETTEELDKLRASNGLMITSQQESGLAAAETARDTLKLADAQAKLASETDPLKAANLRVQIEKLKGSLGNASGATTGFIDNTKKIGELEGVLDGYQGEIDETIGKIGELAAASVAGFLETQIAADGQITQSETDMYAHFLHANGLIDETTMNLMTRTTEAVTAVNDGTMDAIEASNFLTDEVDDTALSYTELGEEGAGALADIETATGSNVARMIDLAIEAGRTQSAIDNMHGKDIDINLNVNQIEHRNVGDTGSSDYEYNAAGGFIPVGQRAVVGDGGRAEVAIATPAGVRVVPTTTQTYNINNMFQSGTNPNQVIGMQMALYGGG